MSRDKNHYRIKNLAIEHIWLYASLLRTSGKVNEAYTEKNKHAKGTETPILANIKTRSQNMNIYEGKQLKVLSILKNCGHTLSSLDVNSRTCVRTLYYTQPLSIPLTCFYRDRTCVEKHCSSTRSLQNTATAVKTIDSSPLQTHLVKICSHIVTKHSSVGIECRHELRTRALAVTIP